MTSFTNVLAYWLIQYLLYLQNSDFIRTTYIQTELLTLNAEALTCLSTFSLACSSFHSFSQVVKYQSAVCLSVCPICPHVVWRSQFESCSSYNLVWNSLRLAVRICKLTSHNTCRCQLKTHYFQHWSPSSNALSAFFLRLRFDFDRPMCTFTNYVQGVLTYLLTL